MIAEKIYDAVDDISYGGVNSEGALSTPSASSAVLPPKWVLKEESDEGVQLSWLENLEPNIAGYKVHYGAPTGYSYGNSIDIGNVTSYNLAGASVSDEISVTAYDTAGYESWYSISSPPVPVATLTPLLLDFGVVAVGEERDQTFNIENTGTGNLSVSSILLSGGDFSISPSNFTVSPGNSETVTVTFVPTAEGDGNQTLTVTHNASSGSSSVELVAYGISGTGTAVRGILPIDTTWAQSDSPYYITGDVQIPSGVTLTIEPGVEIRYTGGYELLVQGVLIANGTAESPIVFTSTTPGTSSGATMLKFEGSDLDQIQINHVQMRYADKAIRIGDESEHNQGGKNTGTLTVSNIEIESANVLTDGYDTTAKLLLQHVTLNRVEVKGNYPRSEPIEIDGGTITASTIFSDSYNKGVTLKSITVTDSILKIGCCGGNFKLIDSTIQNSNIVEGGGSPVTGPLEISNSKLNNSPINLPAANIVINSSAISYDSGIAVKFGNGVIDHSTITGRGDGVGLEVTGLNGYNIGGSVTVSDSVISNNAVGIKINNANSVVIENTSFTANSSYNIENLSENEIAATANYWGTTDAAVIASSIFDYFDDINYGAVEYSPMLNLKDNYIQLKMSGINHGVLVGADGIVQTVPSSQNISARSELMTTFTLESNKSIEPVTKGALGIIVTDVRGGENHRAVRAIVSPIQLSSDGADTQITIPDTATIQWSIEDAELGHATGITNNRETNTVVAYGNLLQLSLKQLLNEKLVTEMGGSDIDPTGHYSYQLIFSPNIPIAYSGEDGTYTLPSISLESGLAPYLSGEGGLYYSAELGAQTISRTALTPLSGGNLIQGSFTINSPSSTPIISFDTHLDGVGTYNDSDIYFKIGSPDFSHDLLGPENPTISAAEYTGSIDDPVAHLVLNASGDPTHMFISEDHTFANTVKDDYATNKKMLVSGVNYIYAMFEDISNKRSLVAFVRPKELLYVNKTKLLAGRPVAISVRVTAGKGDVDAYTYYRQPSATEYIKKQMVLSDGVYTAWIPSEETTNGVEYYISIEKDGAIISTLPSHNPGLSPLLLTAESLLEEEVSDTKESIIEFAVGLTVKVPLGALNSATKVQVSTPDYPPTPPKGIKPTNVQYSLKMVNGQSSFSKRLSLRFRYNHTQVTSPSTARLRAYDYNKRSSTYRLMKGEHDRNKKLVKFETSHFSDFFLGESSEMYPEAVTNTYLNEDIILQASVVNDVPVAHATLYYMSGSLPWKEVEMVKTGDYHQAIIPAVDVMPEGVSYYIEASDGSNDEFSQTYHITVIDRETGTSVENGSGHTENTVPTVSILADTAVDESGSSATFIVMLSAVSANEVTVDYASSNGTATAGSDYTSIAGTLAFSAGETTKTLTVPVLADNTVESNETIILTLFNANNATISNATGTLTINDDSETISMLNLLNADQNFIITESGSVSGVLFPSNTSTQRLTTALEPSRGTVQVSDNSTGSFTYTPDVGATCVDRFSFNIDDGEGDPELASVTINLPASTETGTICMQKGWNLMGTPLSDTGNLQALLPDGVSLIASKGEGEWSIYSSSNQPGSTLMALPAYKGFWVLADKRMEVILNGNQNAPDYSGLLSGWSLISVEDGATIQAVCDIIFSETNRECQHLFAFNPTSGWESYDFSTESGVLNNLSSSQGVWVNIQ